MCIYCIFFSENAIIRWNLKRKNSFNVFAEEIESDDEEKEESKPCDNNEHKTKIESERKNDQVMKNDK